ncbi:hypothetical protein DH2020_020612 [Rehmannia glutinosa]|uniref:Uncharacterized protein n=1 Tax=Rehmannia glutinosa TaxID=99300 RepID=A0ABR0WGR2_REHGL
MYSSNSTEYQKFSDPSNSPPPAGVPPTGIPVSSSPQFYSDKSQPPARTIPAKPKVPWSTGLCDCFSDFSNSCGQSGALYTLLACVTGCPCFYSCFYRSKMRQQYLLHESPCGDCLVHCFCESCALCQEYRELKNRGFDMSIGWHGNVERQNRGVVMAPITEGEMSR